MLNLTHPFPARLYKMTMVQPKKGFPKLRGRAADMASLDKTMLALWDSLMGQENTQHKQIKLFLEIHRQLCELLLGSLQCPTPRHSSASRLACRWPSYMLSWRIILKGLTDSCSI